MRSLVSGESLASVTSSGRAPGATGATRVADAAAPRRPERARTCSRSGPCSGRRPGWRSSSSPQAPVWPGDGPDRDRPCRSASAVLRRWCRARSGTTRRCLVLLGVVDARVPRSGRRRPAVPRPARMSWPKRYVEHDQQTPAMATPEHRTKAPGRVTSGTEDGSSARPIRPPGIAVRRREPEQLDDAEEARRTRRRCPRRVIPQPGRLGRVAGPHSSTSPRPAGRTAAASASAPNHGAIDPGPPVGQATLAGQGQGDRA